MSEDIEKIKSESIGRKDVEKMMEPLKTDIKHLAEQINVLEGSSTKGSFKFPDVPHHESRVASEAGSLIEAKISDLEKKIGLMSGGKASHIQEERHCNMIVVGLDGFTNKILAASWVSSKMLDIISTTTFTKSDWISLLFFQFNTPAVRNKAVIHLRKVRLEYEGKMVWSQRRLTDRTKSP